MAACMIWDISQKLSPTLPVWPGDTRFSTERTWELADGCPVNVGAIRMSTHSGTHADAPLHYHPAGVAIDAVALDPYIGRAQLIDVRGLGSAIEPQHLEGRLADGIERVLLRSFDAFPHDRWASDFTAIAAETIDMLAARGVRLIGTDAPSLDPEQSKEIAAHQAALRTDMRILEGLVLDAVAPGEYELIALPLPLAGLDAAPVRAILRSLS